MDEEAEDKKSYSNGSLFHRTSNMVRNVISNITVEPALFIMFLGLGLDHSTLDQMQIDKCCRDDFDFNKTVCDHLNEDQYETEKGLVSDEVNIFYIYSQGLSTNF